MENERQRAKQVRGVLGLDLDRRSHRVSVKAVAERHRRLTAERGAQLPMPDDPRQLAGARAGDDRQRALRLCAVEAPAALEHHAARAFADASDDSLKANES